MVDGLFIGMPTGLKDRNLQTGINKTSVKELDVKFERIVGDGVANLKHHGGVNRVLHQYASENYDFWNNLFSTKKFQPGCLGENLSAKGMDEANVCIGDIYQIGEVECVVTEPRKPCGMINLKMDLKGLAKQIQNESKTGWFYRILKEGIIRQGDSLTLLKREFPELTLEKCIRALLHNEDVQTLRLMINNPVLSTNWKEPAKKLLISSTLADDSLRLGE